MPLWDVLCRTRVEGRLAGGLYAQIFRTTLLSTLPKGACIRALELGPRGCFGRGPGGEAPRKLWIFEGLEGLNVTIWDTLQVTLGPKCYNEIKINVNTLQTYTFSILKHQNQIHCISVRKVCFTHLDTSKWPLRDSLRFMTVVDSTCHQRSIFVVIHWAMKQSVIDGLLENFWILPLL